MISKEKMETMKKLHAEKHNSWSEEDVKDLIKCMEMGFSAMTIHKAGVFEGRTERAISSKMSMIRRGETDA